LVLELWHSQISQPLRPVVREPFHAAS
jgi:hypothetical protein